MDIVNVMEFVKPELLVLVPVCWIVGAILKHTEKINTRFIPALLGLLGVLLAGLWVLATSDITGYKDALMAVFVALVQGIIAAGLAVYGHQLTKTNKEG